MKNTSIAAGINEPLSSSLSDAEQQFIQQISLLLAPRGLSPSTGRVYGYMLLRQGPVGVDQIATDLEMSRVGAWSAARNLEAAGHIVRQGVPGSKRALYRTSDNFGAPMLEMAAVLGQMGELLEYGSNKLASGDEALQLKARADYYRAIQDTMNDKIATLNAQRDE